MSSDVEIEPLQARGPAPQAAWPHHPPGDRGNLRNNIVVRCSNPACGVAFDSLLNIHQCSRCGDLLEIHYPAAPAAAAELQSRWRSRRTSDDPADRSGVWRFRELLPAYATAAVVTLCEGNTPLLPAPHSAAYAAVDALRFKHQGCNPTGCFKDLGMTVAMTEARFRGAAVVACASTGNTAGSMAAYAARAGIAARVYLPEGKVSRAKLAQSLEYGAEIVTVAGNFDQALTQLLETESGEVYFLNSINPFRIEGQKTVLLELLEQLAWESPDFLVLPAGNLGNTAALGKALVECHRAGLIRKLPRIVAVQAHGANAFLRTYQAGDGVLRVVEDPQTAATAIRIGAPKSWRKALAAIELTHGLVTDVTDEEIRAAKQVIGREGIGCEPASAATLAGIRKLVASGHIHSDANIVAILTGHVLKDTEFILNSN